LLHHGLQLIVFLRTVQIGIATTLDGWVMLLAFHFPSLYLRIALGSSGRLHIIDVSSAMAGSGMLLVGQGKKYKKVKNTDEVRASE
jgi:hypothetical protein